MSLAQRQRVLVSALLAGLVLAVYAPVAGYDFINIDDAEYVQANAAVKQGLSWTSFKWAWTHPVAGNWHPLTMLSHMVDAQLYGLSAGGHHFTNVLWHTANVLLLFWLLLRWTRREGESGAVRTDSKLRVPTASAASPLWACAMVAALFALHPLHVESVAWISERKDVLSGFFFLLTLWAYGQYAQLGPRKWAWYSLALGCFTLGLLSKSMLVTLPFVLLLLDYWPLRRWQLRRPGSGVSQPSTFHLPPSTRLTLVSEKLPFFALAACFSVLTFHVQQQAGAVVSLEHFPLVPRLANALISYACYLGQTVWPAALAMPYPFAPWTTWQVQGATLLFLGLSLLALAWGRRRPYLLVGWGCFAGMLVPVIGLVQVGLQARADHYTYLPLLGLFLALVWALRDWAHTPARRCFGAWLGALLVAALTLASAVQVHYWKNSEALFTHAVKVTPNNSQAHYLLGAIFDSQGKAEAAQQEFARAVEANPGNVKAHCGLGYLLSAQGRWTAAAQEYEAALHFEPDSPKAHFGLAEALLKQGQPDLAMSHYLAALRSNPDIAEAHYQLAGLFSRKQDPAAGLVHLREALRLAPDWTLALNNLAWMLSTQPQANLRDGTEATRLALRAVNLTGRTNPNTLDTLAAAYAETGRFTDAVATALSAVEQAHAAHQNELAAEITSRLKLYQSQRAYRE